MNILEQNLYVYICLKISATKISNYPQGP